MELDHEVADQRLHRTLSFQHLFFLSMGGIIGSGWLFAVLGADALAGPAVVFSWLIAGALTLVIALTFAEVAGMLPRSGAVVRYPHMTHGGFTGFLLGWAYWISTVTTPTIEAEGVVSYTSSYVPGLTHLDKASGVQVLTAPGLVFGGVLLILFFVLNFFGVRFLGRFNTVITWWKFLLPTATFILLFFAFNGSNFTNTPTGFLPHGIAGLFEAISVGGIVFSYLGFRMALDFGGEARNPQRDVPLATIAAVLSATALYTLLQIAFTGAIHWSAAGVPFGDFSRLKASSWSVAPFASEMRGTGLAFLVSFAVLLQIDAWVSPSGTGIVYMGNNSRTFYGMAMDRYFPGFFTQTSRFGIPLWGLVGSLVVGWVFLAPLPSWYLLVGVISAATVLTFVMGGVALTVLRRTADPLHRPFHLWGANILAPFSFVAAGWIVYWSGLASLNYIIGGVFIGLPLYAWFYGPSRHGMSKPLAYTVGILYLIAQLVTDFYGPFSEAGGKFASGRGLAFGWYTVLLAIEVLAFAWAMWALSGPEGKREISASLWFIAFLFSVYIISYFGAYGPVHQIPFPVDTILVGMISLMSYYWAVSTGFETREIRAIVAAETGQAAPERAAALNGGSVATPSAGAAPRPADLPTGLASGTDLSASADTQRNGRGPVPGNV